MFSISQFRSVLVVLTALCGISLAGWTQGEQNLRPKTITPVSTRAKQIFASTCAACHGLDGRGGERAPNIAENPKVQRLSDAQIAHIIQNGLPSAGMPAFHSLAASDIKAVVTYLRTLQGGTKHLKLPGNPERGESIFFGKAGCSRCHMISGKGGFIASDLSTFAATHSVEEILTAITIPASPSDKRSRIVTAHTRGGESVSGIIRNEDNFSLQLQALDGTFYSMTKSDLDRLEYSSQPIMPADYNSTLSPDELNNIVSYLMSAAGVKDTQVPRRVDDWEEP